jgi:3-oxoacyl-[acyl-carrier-protein] synthase II
MAATGTVACMSGLLAQQLDAAGPGFTVSATCSSGANAIALAAQQLLLGEADVVIAGGSDAPVHPLVLRGLESAGMLGSSCRPFDERRDGLVIGEGAGFLVLERQSHAHQRGAEVLARLDAWATGVDGRGRTGIREDGSGLVDVLGRSLELAGLQPGEIGYVNAHGTATELNDRVEAATLARVFGDTVPVSSTKAATGHCLGGTPAIEAIIAVQALRSGLLPPTSGLGKIAADCAGIDLVVGGARETRVAHVVSDSIGFWGYHACLVIGAA